MKSIIKDKNQVRLSVLCDLSEDFDNVSFEILLNKVINHKIEIFWSLRTNESLSKQPVTWRSTGIYFRPNPIYNMHKGIINYSP